MKHLVATLLRLSVASSTVLFAAVLEAQRSAASAGVIVGVVHSENGAPLAAATVILRRPADT
ncbi:MAG TPA: hypothetical protein VJ596_02875, partial [Gemmatimonadaceae bacterium]|nr:hypothetical protein [Gemmatimonadaceae bacterium]